MQLCAVPSWLSSSSDLGWSVHQAWPLSVVQPAVDASHALWLPTACSDSSVPGPLLTHGIHDKRFVVLHRRGLWPSSTLLQWLCSVAASVEAGWLAARACWDLAVFACAVSAATAADLALMVGCCSHTWLLPSYALPCSRGMWHSYHQSCLCVCVPDRHVLACKACKACSAGHAFHPLGARHDRALYIECVGVLSCSATTAVLTDQGFEWHSVALWKPPAMAVLQTLHLLTADSSAEASHDMPPACLHVGDVPWVQIANDGMVRHCKKVHVTD